MDNEKLDGLSMNIEQTEQDKLRNLFPQCFVEGKLDIDKLLSMCGEYITDDFEKYEFKWKGKSECLQLAQKRSTGTLRPCREDSINFDTTQNLYIEGDNLEVLKLLQTSYYRKVKMVYIDPPYNTGNDFVYEDDFADPMARYKEITSQTTKSNPETMGRFHTNWLNMMYPRLRLAANLLRDDGVIFISIDDNEVHNLRKLCDEVFGEENFVAQINWKGRGGRQDSKYYAVIHEYILCYAKSIDYFVAGEEVKSGDVYPKFDEEKQRFHKTQLLRKWGSNSRREDRPNLYYSIPSPDGSDLFPMLSQKEEGCWRWGKVKMQEALQNGNIEFVKNDGVWVAYEKIFAPPEGEEKTKKYVTWVDDISNGTMQIKELFGTAPFDYAKSTELIKHFIKMSSVEENDIILDFFSGSATTAHAVMQLNAEDGGNRRFICVQLPEVCDEKSEAFKAGYKNICEIGKERIRRAGAKLSKTDGQMELSEDTPTLDIGFRVFKLDTSNLKIWDNTPILNNDITELERRLLGMLEIIKDDRSNLDVVYEVMLKLGQDLCEDIIELDINGKTVYGVGADITFIICLAEHITPEDAEAMAEYAPGRIIFTDQCFDNLSDKSNVKLIMRERGITLKTL